jgi:triosephosphate isomerase
MRRKTVLGNWKMNGTLASVSAWCSVLQDRLGKITSSERDPRVGVLPPFPYLEPMARALESTGCQIGAQDLSPHEVGAFTGEVSGAMLSDLGCACVLVGHSERRTLHRETDALVAAKFAAALRASLTPILCVGETLDEREAGVTERIVEHQLAAVLATNGIHGLARAVIAYEPVWAIGTGRTATPEQAQEVHAFIRGLISASDAAVGASLAILYGGSVKAANAVDLFAMPDIDGALVGGACLDALEFATIVRAA